MTAVTAVAAAVAVSTVTIVAAAAAAASICRRDSFRSLEHAHFHSELFL